MDKRLAMIIALVMAALAALLMYGYLDKVRQDAYKGLDRVSVLVASQDIAAGDTISVDNVGFLDFPEKYVGQRAVSREQGPTVLGAVAQNNIQADQPILWTDIKRETLELRQGLADLVEQGMRAVTIPVSGTSGLDGMLQSMQRVDVLFTFDLNKFAPSTPKRVDHQPSFDPTDIESMKRFYYSSLMGEAHEQLSAAGSGKRTAVLFENMLIIAVGSDMHQGMLPRDDPEATRTGYSSVTFLATPEQARILAFCSAEGKFDLVLRRTGDLAPAPPSGMVSYSTVLNLIQKKLPDVSTP